MAYVVGSAGLWAYSAEGSGNSNFGKVQEESASIIADLTAFPFFGSTSDETDVDDMGGVVFKLTVVIEKTTTTAANMATFLTALKGLINGQQTSSQGYPFTYQSTLFGSIQVKITRIDVLSLSPNQLVCSYTIVFLESA